MLLNYFNAAYFCGKKRNYTVFSIFVQHKAGFIGISFVAKHNFVAFLYKKPCGVRRRVFCLNLAAALFCVDAHYMREAAVDISDLAGDAASQIGQHECRGIANIFDRHVAT